MFHSYLARSKAEKQACEQFLSRWITNSNKLKLYSSAETNNSDYYFYALKEGNMYGCLKVKSLPHNDLKIEYIAIDPALRGETLLSLLFQELYQLAVQNQIKEIKIPTMSLLEKTLATIGFKPNPKNSTEAILQVTSFHDILKPESQDKKNNIKNLNRLWAEFADIVSRDVQNRPNLFYSIKEHEKKQILYQMPTLSLTEGTSLKTHEQKGYLAGVVESGLLGDGIQKKSGLHLIEVYRTGDSFIHGSYSKLNDMLPQITAIEDSSVKILTQSLLEKIKKTTPKLASILSMNLIAVEQHIEMNLEDYMPFYKQEEEIAPEINPS